MHIELWQLGLAVPAVIVGVSWLLLLPLAIKQAAKFTGKLAKEALQFAFTKRGEMHTTEA